MPSTRPVSRQEARFEALYRKLRESVFGFCEAFNFEPTYQQAQLLLAVEDAAMRPTGHNNWIACRSGQGPGKTTSSAIAGLWWAFRNWDCRGIITAPTMRQCKDIWLVEAGKWIEKADPDLKRLFHTTKTKVQICGRENWGVSLATATKDENAQGYHNEHQFVIVEEASGVARPIITQYKGTNSNVNSLLLLIGNPNTRDCALFDCFNGVNRKRWVTLVFNAEDTAKYYPHIVSPQRNKDLEEEFGRESDVYRVRVLGEFPLSDPKAIFTQEELNECCDAVHLIRCSRLCRSEDTLEIARQIGLDYARFGGDESVVMRRSGEAIVERLTFAHEEPTNVTRAAMGMQPRAFWTDEETIYVPDADGMGQGTMGLFYEEGKQVWEWHTSAAAVESGYANLASEGWFSLRRKVRYHRVNGGLPRVCLPLDQILIRQLCTRYYFTDKKGRIVLEDKDSYMKRGHDSPDRADCCVQAMWDGVTSNASVSVLNDYDRPRIGRRLDRSGRGRH